MELLESVYMDSKFHWANGEIIPEGVLSNMTIISGKQVLEVPELQIAERWMRILGRCYMLSLLVNSSLSIHCLR